MNPRPPAGLERKSAPDLLEPTPARASAPGAGATTVDPDTGIVTALVAVTGVRDDVNDIIEPGAFARSLRERTPRMVVGHDWGRLAGKALSCVELLPGDPRLPRTAPDGSPWPRRAGALWVKARYLLGTREGDEQYAIARAFGPSMAYSVGYRVPTGGAQVKAGVRHITDLDVFEFSPVLHGANRLATQLSLKGAAPVLETKGTDQATRRRSASPFKSVSCGICSRRAGGTTGVPPSRGEWICGACLDQIDELTESLATISLAELSEADDLDASAETMYAQALDDEQQYEMEADGTLTEAGAADSAVGRAWRQL